MKEPREVPQSVSKTKMRGNKTRKAEAQATAVRASKTNKTQSLKPNIWQPTTGNSEAIVGPKGTGVTGLVLAVATKKVESNVSNKTGIELMEKEELAAASKTREPFNTALEATKET